LLAEKKPRLGGVSAFYQDVAGTSLQLLVHADLHAMVAVIV